MPPATTERVFPGLALPVVAGRPLPSPFQFYSTGEDNLRLVTVNALTGVRIAVQGRRLTPEGTNETFAYEHTPNTDRSPKTQMLPLGKGAVQNIAIFASAGAPLVGQTLVMLQLVRGLSGGLTLLGPLLGGYVTATQPLGFPGSIITDSLSVTPPSRLLIGTDPAPGVEIVETVPTGARWDLLAFATLFTCGPGIGNRRPILNITDPAGFVLLRSPQAHVMVAGESAQVTWAAGMGLSVDLGGYMIAGLPTPQPLLEGQTIQISVSGLQAADDFAAPGYSVRESLEAR